MKDGKLPFNSEFWLTVTGVLIFLGAVGKSAQFPLHVWLPDAMEGPTPVSALIHAATMVAAGVFFITRVFTMLTGDALLVIATIGALSAFIPATIAVTQNDIKKILAYSTVSQLGYMVLALGIGAYSFAFFHLIAHAFFKACLFLGSGSVIHSMHHEQDITRMGGLRKKMPITYITFLIATLALSGIPLTSGFLSKDGILAGTVAFGSLTGIWWFSIVGFTVALLTAFYMFRLVILTFHGKAYSEEKFEKAHESKAVMFLPLVILSALSLFIWFTPNPFNADAGLFKNAWIKVPELSTPDNSRYVFMKPDRLVSTPENEITLVKQEVIYSNSYSEAIHNAHYPAMIFSLLAASLGILLAFIFYQWKKVNPDNIVSRIKPLYKLSLNKWYFDQLYDNYIVTGVIKISHSLAWFDSVVIDGVVNGTATVTRKLSKLVGYFDSFVVDGFVNGMAYISGMIGLLFRNFQTGRVQTYIVMLIFSLVILLFLFKTF
jgi:NADH-quinone oxidoreductase subunit L